MGHDAGRLHRQGPVRHRQHARPDRGDVLPAHRERGGLVLPPDHHEQRVGLLPRRFPARPGRGVHAVRDHLHAGAGPAQRGRARLRVRARGGRPGALVRVPVRREVALLLRPDHQLRRPGRGGTRRAPAVEHGANEHGADEHGPRRARTQRTRSQRTRSLPERGRDRGGLHRAGPGHVRAQGGGAGRIGRDPGPGQRRLPHAPARRRGVRAGPRRLAARGGTGVAQARRGGPGPPLAGHRPVRHDSHARHPGPGRPADRARHHLAGRPGRRSGR